MRSQSSTEGDIWSSVSQAIRAESRAFEGSSISILYIHEIKCLCGGDRVHKDSKGVSGLVQVSVVTWEKRKS